MKNFIKKWNDLNIVKRILIGLCVGAVLGVLVPEKGQVITLIGSLFVGALKAVAPILVFLLVMAAIAQHKKGKETSMKSVILLYGIGTLLSAFVAVGASFLFPTTLTLVSGVENVAAPGGVADVLKTLLLNIVDNPVNALVNANYIGILSWAVALGLALRYTKDSTKEVINDLSDSLSKVVGWVIELAPFGIMGLIYDTIANNGLSSLVNYGRLILVLVGSMAIVALVVNPLIVYMTIKRNPYPLVFQCLKESGITAFFTRSSAANIPVNMKLCEKLGLNKDTYSVSIPLGATVNMAGAAVTISVLSLAAAHTLGISIDLPTALILSVLATVSAAGTSGVAGGSLMLIPLACSLFGIPNDIAMQVVGVGFIIGVIQDSCETAINSSTDVLFTAAAEFRKMEKHGKEITINNKQKSEKKIANRK